MAGRGLVHGAAAPGCCLCGLGASMALSGSCAAVGNAYVLSGKCVGGPSHARLHSLAALCSVLRPGGRFLCLEFSKVGWAVLQTAAFKP